MALKSKAEALLQTAQGESRKLNADEEALFNEYRSKMADCDKQVQEIDAQLEAEKRAADAQIKQRKNTNKRNMFSLTKEIRNAMENGTNKFTISENRAVQSAGGFDTTVGEGDEAQTVHTDTHVMETETKSILQPLFAKSLLNSIGATIYTGLPMGAVSVPVASGGNDAQWVSENGEANETTVKFANVKLTPHRLAVTCDISKTLIATDTLGVENTVREIITKALRNRLEATIFGEGSGDADTPAGIFSDAELKGVYDFDALVNFEADLDDTGVENIKYVLSPKAKAKFRQMAKGAKSTQLVYENNSVDGTDALVSSHIPANKFIYGDAASIVIGLWSDAIECVVDPFSQANRNCIRLTLSILADAKLARKDAILFGTTV